MFLKDHAVKKMYAGVAVLCVCDCGECACRRVPAAKRGVRAAGSRHGAADAERCVCQRAQGDEHGAGSWIQMRVRSCKFHMAAPNARRTTKTWLGRQGTTRVAMNWATRSVPYCCGRERMSCRFLGLLHMEVFRQRLEDEHGAAVISTPPAVPYTIDFADGERLHITNPSQFPLGRKISSVWEPTVRATIITPARYVGALITLCQDRRGDMTEHVVLDPLRTMLRFDSQRPAKFVA